MIGRVWSVRGTAIEVRADGKSWTSRFRKRAKRERTGQAKLCAVGDEVRFADTGGGEAVIDEVLPRRSRLSRQDPAAAGREQVIVANLDALVVVVAAKSPDLDLLTVDKCLVLGAAGGIPCALVVNKADLAPEGLESRIGPYRRIGIPTFLTSAVRREGLGPLREHLRGRMVSLVGPSGVGKSSLVNALLGLDLRTGAVSERLGRGKHTTTWATLIEHPEGILVDTPGMEFFTPWGVTPANLKDCFVEFAGPAASCKFRDCVHVTEPKCGVREAVTDGRVPESRYQNYGAIRRLLETRGKIFDEWG